MDGMADYHAGAYRANLIRLGCFLTDLADLDAFRQARDEYLGDGPRPASTLVQVAALVVPGARIEIDALAGA
jgi:enamine deaminase RidA (YjgF/YER057c/UK114 family)